MKSLELTIRERLLIVEMTGDLDTANIYSWNLQKVEQICWGSELTEEHLWPDKDEFKAAERLWIEAAGTTFTQELDAFISAVEAKGHYWKEVPWDFPLVEDFGYQTSSSPEVERGWMYEGGEEMYYEAVNKYEDAESRSFNPKKTLIFKIL